VKDDGFVVNEDAKKSTHDEIMIQGTLESGAVMSVSIRGGSPFKDAPGLVWSIYGEKGEIRVKGPTTHIQMKGTTSIELHSFETDTVQKIELEKGAFDEMSPAQRNVARLYEAIAAGDNSVLCDFQGAVKRHELVDKLYRQN
jgi:predicted dehydrogenase